jgi:pimeloyl-ACP methyl ester carboxylesterase
VGSLVHNTVADSIADCEAVRKHAKVVQWAAVYGGSNGAMLGLAYAASHPGAVGSIVQLRLTPHPEFCEILRSVWCNRHLLDKAGRNAITPTPSTPLKPQFGP